MTNVSKERAFKSKKNFNALKVQKYLVSYASFIEITLVQDGCVTSSSEDHSAQNESHRTFVSYGTGIFVASAALF